MVRSRRSTAAVDAALEAALAAGEVGLQVAAYVGDELVVDAWAGSTEPGGAPVGAQTLFPVFSVTKAVTATAAHLQVQRGLLDYDQPVSEIWPEYGARGKERITLGHVLSHRSGAPQIPTDTTLDQLLDWSWMVARIADQVPASAPDTVNAYSPYAFGWIVGELVRITDPLGRRFVDFLRDEVLGPLGMREFHLGLPEGAVLDVARLVGDDPPTLPEGGSGAAASPAQLPFGPSLYNDPRLQAAGLPSAGGIATARSTARLFALYARRGMLHGEQFLTEATMARCLTPRPATIDETYGYVMPIGLGGLWQVAPGVSASSPDGTLSGGILAHTGAGGTVAWAELSTGLSVAIVHNRTFFGPQDPLPFGQIGDAVHALVRG